MEVLTIAKVERLPRSFRFRVTFTDGRSYKTMSDAQVNYLIENSEYQGVPVEVQFNDRGEIAAVFVAKS